MTGSVDFVTGTLVKSLCSHGGYICCRRDYQNNMSNQQVNKLKSLKNDVNKIPDITPKTDSPIIK